MISESREMEIPAELRTLLPELTDEQVRLLVEYLDLLKQWNRKVNLVSRKDVERLWENHILPSLVPFTLLTISRESRVLDIGSGGGFPAIPWKIVRPDLEMLLVDSVRKKSLFLRQVISTLNLENIAVENERIENLSRRFEYQEKFDIITGRAVTTVETLVQWGKPFLKARGWFLLWKGSSDVLELENAARSLGFSYTIYQTPKDVLRLSEKLAHLCWFQITFP